LQELDVFLIALFNAQLAFLFERGIISGSVQIIHISHASSHVFPLKLLTYDAIDSLYLPFSFGFFGFLFQIIDIETILDVFEEARNGWLDLLNVQV